MEKRRSDCFKAQETDRTDQVLKFEESLCTFRSKGRRTLAEVRTLDVEKCIVLGHLRTLPSKMLGFKAHVARDVEAGFLYFFEG